MKRAAAIVGSTPAHLRWALETNCPWRRPDHHGFAESAARQLKIPQEFATARAESRIFGDWCFRDTEPLAEHQEVWGFNICETLRPFGGLERIESTCQHCPANAGQAQPVVDLGPTPISPAPQQGLAGCFGWLRAMDDQATSPAQAHETVANWSQQIEISRERLGRTDDWSQAFINTRPVWYGIWCRSPLNAAQLNLLFELSNLWLLEKIPAGPTLDWRRLFQAIAEAAQNTSTVSMHVEWVNAGHSDGIRWQLPAFCRNCRAPRDAADRHCAVCGDFSVSEPARHRKVLGLRPYIDLRRVLGESAAYELHQQFRKSRADR